MRTFVGSFEGIGNCKIDDCVFAMVPLPNEKIGWLLVPCIVLMHIQSCSYLEPINLKFLSHL